MPMTVVIYMRDNGQFNRVVTASTQGFPSGSILVTGEEIDFCRAEKKILTKDVARQKILAIMPTWKQNNLSARSIELLEKKVDGTITADELAELTAIRAAWNSIIKPIRTASDAIEAEINGMTISEVKAYDPWKSIQWP